jgi:hypothetical protein
MAVTTTLSTVSLDDEEALNAEDPEAPAPPPAAGGGEAGVDAPAVEDLVPGDADPAGCDEVAAGAAGAEEEAAA